MVDVRHIRTARMRWRKVSASLPALALIASGTALAATTASTDTPTAAAAQPVNTNTKRLARIEVPVQPVHEQATFLQSAIASPLPALALPVGMNALPAFGPVEGSPASLKVVLDRSGIPAPALAAYHRAADLLGVADPGCGLDWAIPAAIGRVESNHARFGGNALDAAGVARPGIIGIPLDGANGTARISDSDRGIWDRDTSWDRAVGPMQFIPGTWRAVGQDADGDGVADPQDMNDAATAAGVYLCSGPGDLRQEDALYKAIFRYNQSDSYVKTVMNLAKAYRAGVTELPVSDLPAATTSPAGGSSDSGFGPSDAPAEAAPPPAQQAPAQAAPEPAQAPAAPAQAAPRQSKPGSAPPPVAVPQLPAQVQAPVNAAKAAVSPVIPVAKVTLTPASVDPSQVLGGILTTALPPAPADLTLVVKSTNASTLNLCFVKAGPNLLGLPYTQVACPANTQ